MMSRALIFSLIMGVASAEEVYEWKGIFYTPQDTYKWGAEKVGGKYADPQMKIVLIPATEASEAALTAATEKGKTAMTGTCEAINSGGSMKPMDSKCYSLVFDATNDQSKYTIDATGVAAIAFFAEHVPTEFEATEHYLKDTSGVDIEPVAQAPEPGEGGGHAHAVWKDEFEGKCVCQAQDHGWTLDCNDKAAIQAAVDRLEANAACKAAGAKTIDACKDDYYVMQAHHDHCLHDQLPTGIEKLLHDYEHFYDDCLIIRQYNPNLGKCPSVNCNDATSMTNAIQTLQAEGACDTSTKCAETKCSEAMKIVVTAHDTCPEGNLPDNLEKALHDHEEACEDQLCNTGDAVFDPYEDACATLLASDATGRGSQGAFFLTVSALALGWFAI
jgi:hypothetical protein